MRVYQSFTKKAVDEAGNIAIAWTSNRGAASKARTALCEEHGLKRNEADFAEVDICTKKEEFLEFLNENLNRQPLKGK